MKPLFSIIMPAKNSQKTIANTINTLRAQTFKDWELIVIDDHSTDDTAKIVKNIPDKRIKYFFLETGNGVAAARDFGNRHAQAEILVTADSDDLFDKNRLNVIYQYFYEKEDIDVFYSNAYLFFVEENRQIVRPFQEFNTDVLKQVNFIINSTTAYKKQAYLDTGFDPKLKMSEDYDLWLSMAEKGYKFGYSDLPLATILKYPASTTGTKKDELKKFIHQVKEKHNLPATADINWLKKNVKKDVFEYFTTSGGKYLWFE